jgi:hypothetical protein
MAVGKMSSQMNPLAKNDFKAMLAEFRSVEIQASANCDKRSKLAMAGTAAQNSLVNANVRNTPTPSAHRSPLHAFCIAPFDSAQHDNHDCALYLLNFLE